LESAISVGEERVLELRLAIVTQPNRSIVTQIVVERRVREAHLGRSGDTRVPCAVDATLEINPPRKGLAGIAGVVQEKPASALR
jgi:hypothetical protein